MIDKNILKRAKLAEQMKIRRSVDSQQTNKKDN